MATQTDAIQVAAAQVEANFATTKAALATIQTDVAALQATLSTNTGLSAADQAALAQLVTDSGAIASEATAQVAAFGTATSTGT